MPRDAVSRTANVGTVGKNGLNTSIMLRYWSESLSQCSLRLDLRQPIQTRTFDGTISIYSYCMYTFILYIYTLCLFILYVYNYIISIHLYCKYTFILQVHIYTLSIYLYLYIYTLSIHPYCKYTFML